MNHFNYLLKSLNKIEDFCKNPKLNENSVANIRLHAFKLQAFGRVIKRAFPKDAGAKKTIQNYAKEIEDAFGNYLYICEMNDFSKKKNQNELQDAEGILLAEIEIFKKKLPELKEHIKFILSINNLDKMYLSGLSQELAKLERKINKINSNLLEDGTHKLRRYLRWVIMYVIYPEGLFQYKKEVKIKKDSYVFLPRAKGARLVDETILENLSQSVESLGKIKDKYLHKHYQKEEFDSNESFTEAVEVTKEIKEKTVNLNIKKNLFK